MKPASKTPKCQFVTCRGSWLLSTRVPLCRFHAIALVACLHMMALSCAVANEEQPDIDFNRDIRAILSDKCFACHGADAANQDSPLRLDSFEHATEDLGGYAGIVPGDLQASEVYLRIASDSDDVMPPRDSNRSLSQHEKALIAGWIRGGGAYMKHWSFVVPSRPDLPPLSEASREWVRNPIDHFVAARLEKEGISPAAEADVELLMRRAALTLTGLPPTPDDFKEDLEYESDHAYEAHVDRILESVDYAERQTLRWLDAARYADTDGYQNDHERKNWPWRDWVIMAFHDNMSFDQFTIEQIAGDMLPDADSRTILASAFNRNHRQNAEGGALAAEFYVENVIDRVETTSTVWLGLTMSCARCHNHKFDPLSQREFYQLFAYFNNIGEKGIGKGVDALPTMEIRSPLLDVPRELRDALAVAERGHEQALATLEDRALEWAEKTQSGAEPSEDWFAANVVEAKATNGVTLERLPDGTWLAGGKDTTNAEYTVNIGAFGRITGIAIYALPHERHGKPRLLAPSTNGNFVLSEVEVSLASSGQERAQNPVSVVNAVASYEQAGYPAQSTIDGRPETGWAVFGPNPSTLSPSASLALEFQDPVDVGSDSDLQVTLKHQSQYQNHHIGRFRILLTSVDGPASKVPKIVPPGISAALATEASNRTDKQAKAILEYYETIDSDLKVATAKLSKVEEQLDAIGATKQPVMVMREREGKPNPAYVLERGQYDNPDQSEELHRAVPAALATAKVANSPPRDRLEFARWLVSRENPLTARVIVNRVWRDHFGVGLVKTVEDFGSQGEYPSHPGLLDWLAVEFMESGWDVKALHRLIVTSATYRQSSRATPEILQGDPKNRLLARGPRYRLDGFSIRDAALQAAGLLNRQVGGPPVKPYQPGGLWESLAANKGTRYPQSSGPDLYRRSLYTYWKRAVNPPRQLIFDAGGREACDVYVRRTNTPLQALALMNDVTFIEAARNVAERVLRTSGEDADRIASMYRLVTARRPAGATSEVLVEGLTFFRNHYSDYPEAAKLLLTQGESPRDESIPVEEHAAWTAVAHLVLNLDEAITVE